jgi:hypothetical protein
MDLYLRGDETTVLEVFGRWKVTSYIGVQFNDLTEVS